MRVKREKLDMGFNSREKGSKFLELMVVGNPRMRVTHLDWKKRKEGFRKNAQDKMKLIDYFSILTKLRCSSNNHFKEENLTNVM